MQTSSTPVITPNRSQSNPDDMITLPRPIQSVGMDLHDVSGTSTGQTLPRERREADHDQVWQPYPIGPYSAQSADHTYVHEEMDAAVET